MTDSAPTAIGGADRPRVPARPVRSPLNVVSKRLRKLDFGPVLGKTAPAPAPRFGAVTSEPAEDGAAAAEHGAPTE